MRRWLALVCLLVLGACSTDAPRTTDAPTPDPTPTPTPANFGRFDVDLAMDHVRALAVEIGPRAANTEGDRLAAAYIAGRLERVGLVVSEQTAALPQGGETTSVIGTPRDFDASRPYVLVGAHRDSIGGPGANDNATGIAVLLEIARATSEVPAVPVRFVAFGAEELQPAPGAVSRVGSRRFVAEMSEVERSNLLALVNLDMLGNGSEIVCGRRSVGPTEGTERCVAEATALGYEVAARVLPDWSDHGPFADEGLNSAWVWTGDVDCCYHNERDTISNVVVSDLERSGKLALAIVRSYNR